MLGFNRVTQRFVGVNFVPVLAAVAMTFQVTFSFKFSDDPLHRPLGDAHGSGYLPKRLLRIPCQADEDVRVVRKEGPLRGFHGATIARQKGRETRNVKKSPPNYCVMKFVMHGAHCMQRYQRLLVPLGLNDSDRPAIEWAAKISHLAGSEDVLFVHALEMPEIPAKAKEKYPWLMDPLDESVRNRMQDLVAKYWSGRPEATLSYRTLPDVSEIIGVLHATLDHESDLIVVGREAFGHELAIRLARKAPCSVMAVPSDSVVKLETILVPTDFSRPSEVALDVGLAFAEAEGLNVVHSVHVYNLSNYSHRVTLPRSELEAIEAEFAEERQLQFIDRVDTRGLQIHPHLVMGNLVAGGVVGLARELQADLIVAGSRGRNTLAALLLGSNAEELLKSSPVPIVAAKIKGSGQSLLKTLLSA